MSYFSAFVRPRSALSAAGLLVAAAMAVPVVAGAAATPAEAKFKFKKLEISHNTRGRPTLIVRRVDGEWKVKNADELFLDIDIHVKSGIAHRIDQVVFRFGAVNRVIYQGRKASNIKINGVHAALNGSELGYLREMGANFCKQMGEGRHDRKFTIEVAIVDGGGKMIWKEKGISGFVRCIG